MADFLEVKKSLAEIQQMYKEDPRQRSFNALVYGGMGTGKTRLLRTCRQPVLVHSFDPGGQRTNEDQIKAGQIIADTRFENEDPMKPTAFEAWDKEYHRLKALGAFNYVGTFAIDSATTWSQAAMNVILKKAGRLGGPPFQQDYLPAMSLIENAVKDFVTLPCDCVLICHEDSDKDEATGKIFIMPLFVGKLKYRIPVLFDEVYVAMSKETSKGTQYQLLTRSTGLYKARSRIGRDGRFEMYEEPDVKNLLRKAGYDSNDRHQNEA